MNFPKATYINRIISRADFMQNAGILGKVRKEFEEHIDKLILLNTLRQDTLNIEQGNNVKEILILEFTINVDDLSTDLIMAIEKINKYFILVLKSNNLFKIIISYKEKINKKFKIIKIFRSPWQNSNYERFTINGNNLDLVYNNFIIQVTNQPLINDCYNLKNGIENLIKKEALENKLNKLIGKKNKEKQLNKLI